ncbi:MAG TPA: hypothetical protein VG711_11250 [Phycisphaerales bacterium]|nr:hypothetical protein [Phycisphaerales bacterium]
MSDKTAQLCGKCGYDLRGLTSNRCPECAEPISSKPPARVRRGPGIFFGCTFAFVTSLWFQLCVGLSGIGDCGASGSAIPLVVLYGPLAILIQYFVVLFGFIEYIAFALAVTLPKIRKNRLRGLIAILLIHYVGVAIGLYAIDARWLGDNGSLKADFHRMLEIMNAPWAIVCVGLPFIAMHIGGILLAIDRPQSHSK